MAASRTLAGIPSARSLSLFDGPRFARSLSLFDGPRFARSLPLFDKPVSLSALIRRTPFRSLSALIRQTLSEDTTRRWKCLASNRTAAPGPDSRERVTLLHEPVNPEPMGKVKCGGPTNQGHAGSASLLPPGSPVLLPYSQD